jgi:hypothetical protein
MKVTLDDDERYYLASALKHAIKRVEQHAHKMEAFPSKGPQLLSERDAHWLKALLRCVKKKASK